MAPQTKVVRKQSEKQLANLQMGSKPGERKGGRQKGTPNKATTAFRDTVTKLLSDNAENVPKWLKAVAEGDPKTGRAPAPEKALDLMAKLAEYAAPKLARTEVVGDPSAPLEVKAGRMSDEDLMAMIARLGDGKK